MPECQDSSVLVQQSGTVCSRTSIAFMLLQLWTSNEH